MCNNEKMLDTMVNKIAKMPQKGAIVLDKKMGETPLECLERFRAEHIAAGHGEFADIPMTYAGRLDPMATGKLLVLYGDECKNKEKYLGLDKEYEVEILFGVETDTGDMLGLIKKIDEIELSVFSQAADPDLYVGKFDQEYPAYSSKTVGGKQLHSLARAGKLPDEMPTKSVEIYSIEKIGTSKINAHDLAKKAVDAISTVDGDFRQPEIIEGWKQFVQKYGNAPFSVLKLRVFCSSGTYMRTLAERIGKDAGTVAFALSIHRTKIIGF